MRAKVRCKVPQPIQSTYAEHNHRQQMALERIEFAVAELATVLLANCRSHGIAGCAITDVRKAVAPALNEILFEE